MYYLCMICHNTVSQDIHINSLLGEKRIDMHVYQTHIKECQQRISFIQVFIAGT
jgi:hypothetical protein